MRRFTLLAVACVAAPVASLAAPPHVHGVALLDVVVDGQTVGLHLDTPLDNLTGFEHPAYNPAQQKALDTMVAQLNRPETLFVPTPAAGCKAGKPKLVSAVLDASGKKPAHGHADLDADFTFQCAQPASLTGIEVKLIDAFPRTHKVKVQLAGPKGQSAQELDAGHRRIAF